MARTLNFMLFEMDMHRTIYIVPDRLNYERKILQIIVPGDKFVVPVVDGFTNHIGNIIANIK
jgi:hypothetical protein